ncbi:MAG: EamA family transporter [Candidatus Thorarchaeota archaeon]
MSVILGLIFGIINTLTLHLAKAMERQGIEIFSRKKSFKEKGKKPLIYVIGFTLNNTIFIWQILGTTFASAAVFSSVFGLGLILLMFYSHFILHEEINSYELIGAVLIIIGTTMVGFFYIVEPEVTGTINYVNFLIIILVMIIFFSILIGFSWKTKIAVAFIFGAVAGTMGGTDNVLKRIGLTSSNFIEVLAGVFRLEIDSFIFLFSFLAGFFALIITQIGFAKGADASKLVPMYNSLYIAGPVFFELLIVKGAKISIGIIISIIVIIIGIFMMNIFKKTKENINIDEVQKKV